MVYLPKIFANGFSWYITGIFTSIFNCSIFISNLLVFHPNGRRIQVWISLQRRDPVWSDTTPSEAAQRDARENLSMDLYVDCVYLRQPMLGSLAPTKSSSPLRVRPILLSFIHGKHFWRVIDFLLPFFAASTMDFPTPWCFLTIPCKSNL